MRCQTHTVHRGDAVEVAARALLVVVEVQRGRQARAQHVRQAAGAGQIAAVLAQQGDRVAVLGQEAAQVFGEVFGGDRQHDHAVEAPLAQDRPGKLDRPAPGQPAEQRLADEQLRTGIAQVDLEVLAVGDRQLAGRGAQAAVDQLAAGVGDGDLQQRARRQALLDLAGGAVEARALFAPGAGQAGGHVVEAADQGIDLAGQRADHLLGALVQLAVGLLALLLPGAQQEQPVHGQHDQQQHGHGR